jgi:hypothetical protein
MGASASTARLKSQLRLERRKNRRLRTLLEELQAQVKENRRTLELQFTRIAHLQAEFDAHKKDCRTD